MPHQWTPQPTQGSWKLPRSPLSTSACTEQGTNRTGTMANPSVHRIQCGILFCEGGQKPLERGSCTITPSSGVCQALELDGGSGYEQVLEGTKCGDERVSDQTRAWTLLPEAVSPVDPHVLDVCLTHKLAWSKARWWWLEGCAGGRTPLFSVET